MATLADVADLAGVSTATASLVLSGKATGRVGAQASQRVRDAAEELGYVRDALAGGLRSQRTRTLGVISEQVLSTPYAVAMIEAIVSASRELGWSVLLTEGGADREQTRQVLRELQSRRVDAIVYAAMYHQEVEVDPCLESVAVLNGFADRPGVAGVVPDERLAARRAVEHLLELGHRRIGHITYDQDSTIAVGLRLQGYREALEEAGLDYREELVVRGASDPAGSEACAHALLSRPEPPSAVFCFNDGRAAGAYRAAARLGLSIPADLSVIGFDDLKLISTNLAPALTTMRLPHYEMAAWLTRAVIGKETEGRTVLVPCELIARDSTAPPP